MLTENLINKVKEIISKYNGKPIGSLRWQAIGGGDINSAFRLMDAEDNYFIKYNIKSKYPLMFEQEAMGLQLLKDSCEINVPDVIGSGEADNYSFLLLQYISSGTIINNFGQDFGRRLANLHKHSSAYFGQETDNYIGSLHQSNKKHEKWSSFFIEERLLPQIKTAHNTGAINKTIVIKFENFFKHIDELFAIEKPALVHGDLWNGNYMVAHDGTAALIDPAVYYGHREMDIAMTKLFGGFANEFYESYNEYYPLQVDWKQRTDYCNLYPLMVHVNLFGGGYIRSVESILNKF